MMEHTTSDKINESMSNKYLNMSTDDTISFEHDIVPMYFDCVKPMNRAIVLLLWDGALRGSELAHLNIGDFHPDGRETTIIVHGKFGTRKIRLIESALAIQSWIEQHPDKEKTDAPLFITKRKYDCEYRRLANNTLKSTLIEMAKKSRVEKNINPHAFRHGRLTDLAKKGLTESELRTIAGWSQ